MALKLSELKTEAHNDWCPGCVLPGTLIHTNPSAKAIEARNLVLDGIVAQMQAIEAQYRSGSAPPEVRAAYRALADRYDALYAEVHAAIDAHNANIQARNEIAGRRNALPC